MLNTSLQTCTHYTTLHHQTILHHTTLPTMYFVATLCTEGEITLEEKSSWGLEVPFALLDCVQ
jgi:hypothetical protein